MEQLTTRYGHEAIQDAFDFVFIRCQGHPDTARYQGEIQQTQEGLEKGFRSWKKAWISWRAFSAEVRYKDDILDTRVGDLSLDVTKATPERHGSVLWRSLFTKPPSEAMAPIASKEEILFVRSLLVTLQRPEYAAFQAHIALLQTALDELLAAVEKRDQAALLIETTRQAYLFLLREACDFYNKLPSRFHVELPFSKRFINSFFPSLRTRPSLDGDGTTNTTNTKDPLDPKDPTNPEGG